MKMLFTILILSGMISCSSQDKDSTSYYHELDLNAAPNTLSTKEKKSGWQLLFDGKSTDGWRGYNMNNFPDCWIIEDGSFTMTTEEKADKGHIALQNHGSDVFFRNIKIKVLH